MSEDTNMCFKRCCITCGTSKTPLWRGGPAGPKVSSHLMNFHHFSCSFDSLPCYFSVINVVMLVIWAVLYETLVLCVFSLCFTINHLNLFL